LGTEALGLVCRCNAGDVFSSPATKLTDSIFGLVVRPYGYGKPSSFRCRQPRVACVRAVADDLPAKAGANLSKGARLSVPERDEVLRIRADDKISAIALECHQPFRTFHARSHWPLLKSHRDIRKKK
jgi:hypothetical protein